MGGMVREYHDDVDSIALAEHTGFQRDLLVAIRRAGGTPAAAGTDTAPHGLAVKAEIESAYGFEIHHGRLYPNLDKLVDARFVAKHAIDRRTNGYTLTKKGVDAIGQYASWAASPFDDA